MIRSKRYTKEMLQFIADTYKKVGIADVAAAFNEKYNSNKTPNQIKATISNHKITCGRTTGEIQKGVLKEFTQEQGRFISEQYQNLTVARLTLKFNDVFKTSKSEKQIRAFTRNHKITSGRTGHFEKGQESWNSGKKGWTAGGRSAETRFKKGRESGDIKPLGATRICSKGGYVIIKVAMPNKWRAKHLVEWEKHNGPIPKSHRLWFKDNDRTNWHIDNLMLITRAQGAVINKLGMGTVPAELKTAAVTLADISMKRRALTNPGAAA